MQNQERLTTEWRQVRPKVLGVLHRPDFEHAAKQISGVGNAGRDSPVWEPWPGYRVGVRGPQDGETPLSWSEVKFGIGRGIF